MIITTGILIFILKYRVHIHVTYTKPLSAKRPSRGVSQIRSSVGAPESSMFKDLQSALVNCGATRAKARTAAEKACSQTSDFDKALRLAMQFATRKDAA